MFKSTFSKYITAFTIIIFVSFAVLSGIITSMIRSYATDAKENELVSTSSALAKHIISAEVEDLENHAMILQMVVSPIINRESELDILIIDASGKVLLSTIGAGVDENTGERKTLIYGDLGQVNVKEFSLKQNDSGEYLVYHGNLGNLVSETSMVCGNSVVINGVLSGYVFSMASTAAEDNLISITRRAVINSSIWIMLAAVIAVYFITERIIHPLRNMTAASKKFAKGDFSTRVTVYGKDEVSELANSFNNMAESLQNLEKMRNSFLASVSHDLRTPMTTISGFIDGITSGAIPPEKQDYYLGVISVEVHRLSRLVSQLLDVSRLESGDRKFDFSDFDVAEMARIILISFEQKIDDKHLDVEFYSDDDQMMVTADKDAIHQVIYNLCHNAIKFANDGGKFKINITSVDSKKIKISIFDEGQTISKEDLNMVFERFYKTDQSRGLDKHGVGLGLYICKTIVEAHGEEIHAQSQNEVGTEFWFTLKIAETSKRKV